MPFLSIPHTINTEFYHFTNRIYLFEFPIQLYRYFFFIKKKDDDDDENVIREMKIDEWKKSATNTVLSLRAHTKYQRYCERETSRRLQQYTNTPRIFAWFCFNRFEMTNIASGSART